MKDKMNSPYFFIYDNVLTIFPLFPVKFWSHLSCIYFKLLLPNHFRTKNTFNKEETAKRQLYSINARTVVYWAITYIYVRKIPVLHVINEANFTLVSKHLLYWSCMLLLLFPTWSLDLLSTKTENEWIVSMWDTWKLLIALGKNWSLNWSLAVMNNLVINSVQMEREECECDWELRHLSWSIEIEGPHLHLPLWTVLLCE